MPKVRGSIPGAAEILILQALPKRKELKTLNKSWCMERRSPYDIQFTVLACGCHMPTEEYDNTVTKVATELWT